MKHTRVSLLALSALAGGVFVASAASTPDMGTNYTLNAMVTANPAPLVVGIYGVPVDSTTPLNTGNYTDFDTDGSGKIDGIIDLGITNLSPELAPYTEAFFLGTVNGTVKSSGKTPVTNVKLSIKGNGYAQDMFATTQAQAAVNLTFSGNTATLMTSGTTNFGTNISIVYLNPDGSTNGTSTFSPYYYAYNYPAISDLMINYHYSDIYTNSAGGTNTINQDNYTEYYYDSVYFGTPLTTDPAQDPNIYTNTIVVGGTNTYYFVYYPLGSYVSWSPGGGWSTNYDNYGLNTTEVAEFMTAYAAAYNSVDTNNTDETITETYTFTTNMYGSDFYTNDHRALSNSWYQLDGTITGTIKAGKTTQKVQGETASLYEYHYVYSLAAGSITNNGTNIIATVYVKAVQYYDSSMNADPIYGFDDEIGMVNNKLYANNDWQIAGTGKGSINAKKQTFSLSEKGTSWSKGSSLKYSGTTVSNLLSSFTALTNISTIVNVAATPSVSTTVTNEGYSDWSYAGDYTDPTTTNVVDTNVFITDSQWYVYAPPAAKTNSVPNGISTFDASGKIMGQTIPTTPVVNSDASWDDFLNNNSY